jgi:GNAT superfamily N-acetyltransferase
VGSGVVFRAARSGDGAGCARAWSDAGRYHRELDPNIGRVPDSDGLADWFERSLADDRAAGALWLVAEQDGRVVGFVSARVEPPMADARWQLQRDLASPRLVIDALVVEETQRRSGVGTALMEAVEEAGRSQGAVVATLNTNLRSLLSVPFYEDRMSYQRRSVIFRKDLRQAANES